MTERSTERSPAAGERSGLLPVAARLGWRTLILTAFALAGGRPFWPTLTTLLALAAALCGLIARVRRERPISAALTHWDEAALYALLSRGAAMLVEAA